MIAYIGFFGIGLRPVFWLMVSEIFPGGCAMSISIVANWGSNFLVSTFFLSLVCAITREGTFWLYGAFGIMVLIFFAFRLPKPRALTGRDRRRHFGPGRAQPILSASLIRRARFGHLAVHLGLDAVGQHAAADPLDLGLQRV